ncbi:MAG: hypothetical protein Q8N44_11020 [Rubrivivax sp.]|nr:hypothetical protein [Rubrivivax sp.]
MPPSDPGQALRLLARAAERGFVTAQLLLGPLHDGERLGRRDLVLAHRGYALAAQAAQAAQRRGPGRAGHRLLPRPRQA